MPTLRPVICVETGEIFPSTTKAALVTGTDQSSISCCCLGKRQTAGGFHWRYFAQKKPNPIRGRPRREPKSKKSAPMISVKQGEDSLWGVLFEGTLLKVFKTQECAEAYASDSALEDMGIDHIRKATRESPLSQKVRHLETGKIYPSIRQAGQHLGISSGGICQVLSGLKRSIKGQHFERVE